jgi:hypothetical protein
MPTPTIIEQDRPGPSGAEFALFEPSAPPSILLGFVEQPELVAAEKYCISADMVPDLSAARANARVAAVYRMEERRQQLRDGEFNAIPLEVDAVGTAVKVEAVRLTFGTDSPQHHEARRGLLTDCERKWQEALRKLKHEYFGVIEQQYVPETDKLYADGLPVDDMIDNGLTPLAQPEEADRRINDAVILAGNKAILSDPELAGRVVSIHASACPDWAIEAFERDPRSSYGGNIPEIEKWMFGSDTFDHDSGKIFNERAAISGILITPDIVNSVLSDMGSLAQEQGLDKTALHAMQNLADKTQVSGVLDFIRRLDEAASVKHGFSVFMGEQVPDNFDKDYNLVILQSRQRAEEIEPLREELAQFVEDLQESGVDHAAATELVEIYIKDRLLEMSEADPELAAVVFNKETAEGFERVQLLRVEGKYAEADLLLDEVRDNAPPASSCGAGSCGLEAVKAGSEEESRINDLLDVKPGEKVVKDTERACISCGKKEVYYAYTSTHVKKGCGNCGKTEGVESRSRQQASRPKQQFTFYSSSENKVYDLAA